MLISFFYLLLRNGTLVIYFFLLFAITRTEYRLRSKALLSAVLLPYAVLCFLLVQNFFTQNVFSVTQENGYSREGLMLVVYGVAAVYGLAGLCYCLYCHRFCSGL